MGYTTTFEGHFNIKPNLTIAQVKEVNDFCSRRHDDGQVGASPDSGGIRGAPGIWCDYEVSPCGDLITWNGNEKSYSMEKWLGVLIKKFFVPHGQVLDGQMKATGEQPGDNWLLVCKDNVVSVKQGRVVYE